MRLSCLLLISAMGLGNAFAMNKAELIDAMAENAGLSKADAKRALDGFVSVTTNKLIRGQEVPMGAMGSLRVEPRLNESQSRKRPGRVKYSNITLKSQSRKRPGRVKYSNITLKSSKTLIKHVYPVYVNRFWSSVVLDVAEAVENAKNNPLFVETGNNGENPLFEEARTSGENPLYEEAGTSGENPLYEGRSAYFSTLSAMGEGMEHMVSGMSPEEIFNEKENQKYLLYLNENLSAMMKRISSNVELSQSDYKRISNLLNSSVASLNQVSNDGIDDDCDGIDDDCNRMSDRDIRAIARRSRLAPNLATKALSSMNTIIANALRRGDRVSLVGFGSFSISKRSARTGRNPQTGKEIKIAAKNVVKFKAGAELSKKVN